MIDSAGCASGTAKVTPQKDQLLLIVMMINLQVDSRVRVAKTI